MSVREYVGARYVPVFATPIDWNSANTYEPLTIVLHEGNSYTSRQAVPAGVQITNTAYWAQTGNYNAQIEQYRQDVAALANRFPVSVLDGGTGGTDAATARTNLDAAQADGATNSLYDAEQAIAANAAAIGSLITKQRFYLPDDNNGSYTIPANSTIVVHHDVSLAGYTPLGIVQSSFNMSGANAAMTFSQIDNNELIMVWRNFASEAKTSKLQFDMLYIKS